MGSVAKVRKVSKMCFFKWNMDIVFLDYLTKISMSFIKVYNA